MSSQYSSSISNNYLTEQLFYFIRFNLKISRIQTLLQEGVDIDARNSEGHTPLLHACFYRRKRIADLLIKSGANVDYCDSDGCTALHHAADNGWTTIIRSLAKKLPNLDTRSSRGETALHHATRNGNLNAVKCLLNKGADIDPKNMVGFTPLICAAKYWHKDIVDLLFNSGAKVYGIEVLLLYYASQKNWTELVQFLVKAVPDLDKKYVDGETDLDARTSRGHLKVVKFLLGEETDMNTINDIIGCAALIDASFFGHLEVVEWVVKRVSNLNVSDSNGETALHHSSNDGHLEIVKCLVEEGADINQRDWNGGTALFRASINGAIEVVKYQIENGADINTRDNSGRTALHSACESGRDVLELVKYLVNKGADIHVESCDGDTPLLCAAQSNHKDVVDLLMYLGANVEGLNQRRFTLLHLASQNGWADIVQVLVKRGFDLEAKTTFGYTALFCACATKKNLRTVQYLLQAGANWDVADIEGYSALHEIIIEERPELLKLFIENGAYLKPGDAVVESSSLKFLQDVKVGCQAIVNKFNNYSLPELYKLPASRSLPCIEKMKIAGRSKVARDIEQTVEFEIQTKGRCNILELQPIVLSVLSVRTILQYYENKKPELQNL